jgi:hypothetical protein
LRSDAAIRSGTLAVDLTMSTFARLAGIFAVVLAGVAVGAWLVGRGDSSPTTASTDASQRAGQAMALNLRGAYLAAGRSGNDLVGLAVRPRGPVEVTVIPPDLHRLPATDVRVRVPGQSSSAAEACGAHCYRFGLRVLAGKPDRLTVSVRARPVVFRLPARLPPVATGLYRTASRAMARVRSVRVDETLDSGTSAIRARFALQAPDRMRYVTSDGNRAVVIGTTRWDFLDGRWRRSDYPRIPQPSYMWDGARFARLVGSARLAGRAVRVLAVFRPDSDYPAWLRLYVTPNKRIVRAEMVAPAHFMVDRLSAFNRVGSIRPPRTA